MEEAGDNWMMQKTHKMGGGFPTITPDSNELSLQDEVVDVVQSVTVERRENQVIDDFIMSEIYEALSIHLN